MDPLTFKMSPEEIAAANAAAGGASSPGGKGPGSHVLDVLGLFDRPRNAIASAVSEGLSDDPGKSALGGFYRGLTGQEQTSWGDVIGIPEPESTDDWGPWLGKAAAHLGVNIIGDPLTYLFAPAKAAGGLRYPARALMAAAGVPEGRSIVGLAASAARLPQLGAKIEEASGLGQLLRRRHPDDAVQQIIDHEYNQLYRTEQEIDKHVANVKQMRDAAGVGPERDVELFSSLERRGENWPEGVDPNLYHAYRPLDEMQAAQLATENALRQKRKMKVIPDASTPDYGYVSHVNAWKPLQNQPASRAYVRWEDDLGNEVKALKGVVTPKDDLEILQQHGIFKNDNGGYYHYSDPNTPIFASPRTVMDDVYRSGYVSPGTFVEEPEAAYKIRIMTGQRRIAFQNILEKLEETGNLTDLTTIGMQDGIFRPELYHLPEGQRQLRIPGLGHYTAEPRLAGILENQAKLGAIPDDMGGKIAEFFHGMMDTWAGHQATAFNTWFKRNVLTSLGRYVGDIFSRYSQLYQDADILAHMIPVRLTQSIKTAANLGEDVFDKLPNNLLRDDLIATQIYGKNTAGLYGLEETGRRGGPGAINRTLGPENPITKFAEGWGSFNDWVLGKGRWLEGVDRGAVVIDRLKQWEKDTGRLLGDLKAQDPETYYKLITTESRYAHDAMIDFTHQGHTPFDRSMSQVFPFWHWIRGILGRELQTMTQRPQRVARAGRFYDTVLQPMSPEDKGISDEYIREQGPTMGAFGMTWDDMMQKLGIPPRSEGARMMLLGRFMPQTHFEQLYHRPGEFLGASVTPGLKTVPNLIRNFDDFRNAPIDPIAGNYGASLVNPLIGRDYQGAQHTRFGVELPAGWDYLLSNSPAGRHTGEASELVRGAVSSLGGSNLDPYKAETDFPEAFLSFLTGRKIYPFSREKQLQHREREASEKARSMSRAAGWAEKKGDYDAAERYREMHQNFIAGHRQQLMEGGH